MCGWFDLNPLSWGGYQAIRWSSVSIVLALPGSKSSPSISLGTNKQPDHLTFELAKEKL